MDSESVNTHKVLNDNIVLRREFNFIIGLKINTDANIPKNKKTAQEIEPFFFYRYKLFIHEAADAALGSLGEGFEAELEAVHG